MPRTPLPLLSTFCCHLFRLFQVHPVAPGARVFNFSCWWRGVSICRLSLLISPITWSNFQFCMTTSSPACLPSETAARSHKKEIPGYSVLWSEFRNSLCPNLVWDLGSLTLFPQFKGTALRLCVLQSLRFNKQAVIYTLVLTRSTSSAEILSPGKRSRCFPAELTRSLTSELSDIAAVVVEDVWTCPRGS